MALTYSLAPTLGTKAPDFNLPAANPEATHDGRPPCSLSDFDGTPALVVIFTCNHCPYAIHIEDELLQVARAYQQRGVAFVAISANDADLYPDDGFAAMQRRAAEKDYPFPYLYDASQEVAKAYGAMCTPDLFVYDADRSLVYQGRFDDTRPRQGTPAHGTDLRRVLDAVLAGGTYTGAQHPSMGCNIKWKPGHEPAYVG